MSYDMQVGLLPQKDHSNAIPEAETHMYNKYSFLSSEPVTSKNILPKALSLIKVSIPNVFTQLSNTFFLFVNLYFIQSSNDSLIIGAYGLAATWFNSTCYSALLSLNNGLFTQVSQVYGAKNYPYIGKLFNKALGIAMVVACMGTVLLLNTESIMIGFGIKEDNARLAQEFVAWQVPTLFIVAFSDCLRNVLLGIQKPDMVMNSYMVSYVTHPIWLTIFVSVFDMKIIGMSIARNISESMILLNLLYRINKERQSNPLIKEMMAEFFEMDTLRGWIPYLKVAIPVGAVVYLEWVFYEVTTIVVGMLKNDDQLAGHTSFSQMTPFFYMVPLGLSMSVNSFLGSCVGDNKKTIAVNFSKISLMACTIEIIMMSIVGILLHPVFRAVLVGNEAIGYHYDYIYNIYVFAVIIPDYFQCIQGAIMRSAGLEQKAMMIFIAGYYVVGVPATLICVFGLELELKGIWYGFLTACTSAMIIFYFYIRSMDWDSCIKSVIERVALEKGENQEAPLSPDTVIAMEDIVVKKRSLHEV